MKIKDYIRERRKALELTLEQVGEYVGVKKATVQKWESGYISDIGRNKIAKLAEILQISPLDIIYDEVNTPHNLFIHNKEENLISDTRLKKIKECYEKMDETGKTELADQAEYIQKKHPSIPSISESRIG